MICPICNFTANVNAFLPYGLIPRPNAQCPQCASMERHRLLWHYLKERTTLIKGGCADAPSRSHAPHGNAVQDASHPVRFLCITG